MRRPRTGSPKVEDWFTRKLGDDLELVISEIGVVADWSAAYTPNSGPMDAVREGADEAENRKQSAQQAVQALRETFANDQANSPTWNSPSTPAA